jgi:polyisoprenyl-phosphate glycosyltransferase
MPGVTAIGVLMPVYNDWEAASQLCRQLDRAAAGLTGARLSICLVDDGSDHPAPPRLFDWTPASLASIDTLRLRCNVGHQRAIALGLAYLYDRHEQDAVLVMDADGEDKPADAVALVERHLADGTHAIFAARRRRFEGWVFRLAYNAYRACHWLLTGIEVRIGNFSILPRRAVGAIVATSEVWSHYAASVVKARLPMVTVPMDRGLRIAGRSTMNYVGLVTHGLSAISVFRELVGTRLLIASIAASALGGAALLAVALLALSGQVPVDRQTAILAALILLLTFQAIAVSFTLAFSVLAGRDQSPFLPIRDYRHYVDSIVPLQPAR